MTTQERNEAFERKHNEVLSEILGIDVSKVKPTEEDIYSFTDKNWEKGISWLENIDRRIPPTNMQNMIKDAPKYYEMLRNNNGQIITEIEDKPIEETSKK